MQINYNISALNAHRNMLLHQNIAAKSLRRLTTGQRINSAADDAAGLAVSEKMRGQIRQLRQESRNAQDMVSMLQTADGGISEGRDILQRMRELAVMAANGTYQDEDRKLLSYEYEALKSELDRIASSANYNGQKLLDGSGGAANGRDALDIAGLSGIQVTGEVRGDANLEMTFNPDGSRIATLELEGQKHLTHIPAGASSASFDLGDGKSLRLQLAAGEPKAGKITGLTLNGPGAPDYQNAIGTNAISDLLAKSGAVGDVGSGSLGDVSGQGSVADSGIKNQADAQKDIDIIDKAIKQLNSQGAGVGAGINVLYYTIHGIDTMAENLTAAESTIRDADMAAEMMTYTKETILTQVAQAMIAQALDGSKTILELLKSM